LTEVINPNGNVKGVDERLAPAPTEPLVTPPDVPGAILSVDPQPSRNQHIRKNVEAMRGSKPTRPKVLDPTKVTETE
jgi:hypothetical protein